MARFLKHSPLSLLTQVLIGYHQSHPSRNAIDMTVTLTETLLKVSEIMDLEMNKGIFSKRERDRIIGAQCVIDLNECMKGFNKNNLYADTLKVM